MYFFQQEEYEEAFYYFHSVKEYKNKVIFAGQFYNPV